MALRLNPLVETIPDLNDSYVSLYYTIILGVNKSFGHLPISCKRCSKYGMMVEGGENGRSRFANIFVPA